MQVRKLTYLQMFGYSLSWASFSIVEVMSQPRFAHKRIGYLAANQSFCESTDVILLTTNLFKKEFTSNSPNAQYEIGLAINCLANIATKVCTLTYYRIYNIIFSIYICIGSFQRLHLRSRSTYESFSPLYPQEGGACYV
jgi:hypothetical protein